MSSRWDCISSSTGSGASGVCSIHGGYLGHACPACHTTALPFFQPFDLDFIQPIQMQPIQPIEIKILESPPPGFRLVSDEKLRRLEELVHELVALAVEVLPD